MKMKIKDLTPSQLYISALKLKRNREWLTDANQVYEPIPIVKLDGKVVMTDGHTRSVILGQLGAREVSVIWDEDKLDWDEYRICVDWCKSEGIKSPLDLINRIVPDELYNEVWIGKCMEMREELNASRDRANKELSPNYSRNS